MKLTETKILKLTCPAGKKDRLVRVDEQRGLYIRVTGTAVQGKPGGRTYLAQYTFAGKKQRIALGDLTLASALSAAAAIMGAVALGRDPAADSRAAKLQAQEKAKVEALTLGLLIERWEAGHLADKRPGYAAEATRALRFAFGKHLKSPAAALTPKAAKAILNDIADAGKKATARLTGAYGRACFGWAIGKDLLTENPFAAIKLAPVAARERVLTDDDLRAIWQATAGPGSFNKIVRILTLTGQRRDEVADMAWSELSGDLSTWTIPAARAKNGVASVVPLPPQVKAILEVAPRYAGNALCFPGERGTFSGWSRSKERLDRDSGVDDWRLHDLRRTCATGLQRLGVRLEVTESVLNHVSGSRAGIVGIYQRHDWADEKRAALAAWGARVEAIVEARETATNVMPIRAMSA
jgi:integrase